MHIRMVWGKLRPGTWEDYERFYTDRVATSANNIKGLRDRHLLRSTEDPAEGISFSMWDTLEDLLAYERGEFRQRIAKEVEHLYRGEYWVKHFEVTSDNQ